MSRLLPLAVLAIIAANTMATPVNLAQQSVTVRRAQKEFEQNRARSAKQMAEDRKDVTKREVKTARLEAEWDRAKRAYLELLATEINNAVNEDREDDAEVLQSEQKRVTVLKISDIGNLIDFSDFNPKKWVINENTTKFVESKDGEGRKTRLLRIAKARMQLAYVRDFVFQNGTIECDLRGGAYLGIAFRVRERGRSELIYVRPPGVPGAEHTIQYIARGMKNFDKWEWLRKNHPGKYETGVVPIPGNKPGRHWWNHPDPFSDEWFHVRAVVSGKEAKVFVGDNKKPSFVVSDLKYGEQSGSVGLYAWRGEFKNFKIRVDK